MSWLIAILSVPGATLIAVDGFHALLHGIRRK